MEVPAPKTAHHQLLAHRSEYGSQRSAAREEALAHAPVDHVQSIDLLQHGVVDRVEINHGVAVVEVAEAIGEHWPQNNTNRTIVLLVGLLFLHPPKIIMIRRPTHYKR